MTAAVPMPDHVKAHLIQTGVITTDGLGRKAQLRRCTRCPAPVIVGLDSHRCALRAICDPVALDQLGEALALIAGRGTYELWGREIERRDQWKISGGIAKPVIPEHQCGKEQPPSVNVVALFIAPVSVTEKCEAPF